MMQTGSTSHPRHRIRNQAVDLYEINADDLLQSEGFVIIDSSLGVMRESGSRPPRSHFTKDGPTH